MMYAGLRKGEVLRLKYAEVDFADKTIIVKGGKGRFGGKDRVVAMPATLRVLLARYVSVRNSRFRSNVKKPVPAHFFISKNNRALSESQFRRIVRIVRVSAGVPFFPHALRHSYISMLLRSRAPLHVVQALAGHNDIETTQRYIAIFDDDKHRAVARLPRLLR
jgi:integrase/recombinase XerC